MVTALIVVNIVATVACCVLLMTMRQRASAQVKHDFTPLFQQFTELKTLQRTDARELREELHGVTMTNARILVEQITAQQAQAMQTMQGLKSELVEQLQFFRANNDEHQLRLAGLLRQFETELRTSTEGRLAQIRETVDTKLSDKLQQLQRDNSARIQELVVANRTLQEEIRGQLTTELEKLRLNNEQKLEQMRVTVDEKLQGTLDRRLGESFKLVSGQLEQVQKGLGEMQTLASDVGGLKRVLTNVKSRGTWGEVQLSRQLEDLLTVDQYQMNVQIKQDSAELVEFAIKLPGRVVDEPVLLPIDSKFPQENYERLLLAQEAGRTSDIEHAAKAIERDIRTQAKIIAEKYIDPPNTTDFAIMYLPTEGLFAEVIRRPGLASAIQTQHRVLITGPTTLMSLLNSLQMGFKTLAIEKRTSEVWQILGAAKSEFHKYGEVWDRLGKQLATAQRTVEQAGVRTRAIERSLREAEVFSGEDSAVIDDGGGLERFIAAAE